MSSQLRFLTSIHLQIRILYGLPFLASIGALALSIAKGRTNIAIIAVLDLLAILIIEVMFERRVRKSAGTKSADANSIAAMLVGSGLMSLTVGLLIVLGR